LTDIFDPKQIPFDLETALRLGWTPEKLRAMAAQELAHAAEIAKFMKERQANPSKPINSS